MFVLHTPRLLIRDFVQEDWLAIYGLSQEPLVTQYQTWLRLSDQAAAQQWVRNAMHHNELRPRSAYNLALVQRHDQQVIGWLGWGAASQGTAGDFSFGYALSPTVWGQGYMTEALRAGITCMFDSLDAQRIFGECALANRASARVMEKSGMTLVSQEAELDEATGDMVVYCRYVIELATWEHHNRQATGR